MDLTRNSYVTLIDITCLTVAHFVCILICWCHVTGTLLQYFLVGRKSATLAQIQSSIKTVCVRYVVHAGVYRLEEHTQSSFMRLKKVKEGQSDHLALLWKFIFPLSLSISAQMCVCSCNVVQFWWWISTQMHFGNLDLFPQRLSDLSILNFFSECDNRSARTQSFL